MHWDWYQYQSQPTEFIEQIIQFQNLDISAQSIRQKMEERRMEITNHRT